MGSLEERAHHLRAGAWRTAIALTLLVAFWAGLAYTFWPELAPALLRLVQSARGVGATQIESTYLEVRNNSSAGETEVREAVARLDADVEAIQAYLGRETDYRIPVLIADGTGPALTDGLRLTVLHDDGVIDLSTAPFLLVLLSEGGLTVPGLNLFVEGGFAVYVAEEIGRAEGLLGQPADAWTVLLRQCGAWMPLADAWEVGVPTSEAEMSDAMRVLLEAGSFVRWVAETAGAERVQELRDGLSLEDSMGLSFAQAEQAWLEAVDARALHPRPCALAVPEGSLYRGFCEQWPAGACP